MPFLPISKIDGYRQAQEKSREDIIDIKFPSELTSASEVKEILIFIVDDDPVFMQILNTHFSKLNLPSESGERYTFKVRNYATGTSCINELNRKPDLIFLNYFINNKISNALSGTETLNKIIDINPNQKVLILDELHETLRGAFVENGLRDYIISDQKALEGLNATIIDILKRP
jgi:two-component system, OmpR family, response regulator